MVYLVSNVHTFLLLLMKLYSYKKEYSRRDSEVFIISSIFDNQMYINKYYAYRFLYLYKVIRITINLVANY